MIKVFSVALKSCLICGFVHSCLQAVRRACRAGAQSSKVSNSYGAVDLGSAAALSLISDSVSDKPHRHPKRQNFERRISWRQAFSISRR